MEVEIEQFNKKEILFYHLIVGVVVLIITLFMYLLKFPIMLCIMVSIILGVVPVETLILYKYAKKQNKNIPDIIGFRAKLDTKQLIATVIIVFFISFFLYGLVSKIEHEIFDNIINKNFRLIPKDFILYKFSFDLISKRMTILILILNFFLNGLVAPIVEELYFRGFLLPRMKIYGKKAPIVNTVLFSLYHFISPYEIITRIISFFPITYAVWKKEDIRISIYIHCFINTLGAIMLASFVL